MKLKRWKNGLALFVVLSATLLRPQGTAAQFGPTSFGQVTWYNAGENNTYALAVGDVNNDGFADIVVTNQHYLEDPTQTFTGVGIFINDGTGHFHLASRYPTDGITGASQSVKIADMDGDGKPDLVVLNSISNGTCHPPACSPRSVSVMRGNGDGTFQAAVSYLLDIYPNTGVSPNKIWVADFNGDGKLDVVVADGVSYAPLAFVANYRAAVSVLLNRGDGTLAAPVLYDSGGYSSAPDVIAADVNADGVPDIVVVNVCSDGTPTDLAANGLCTFVDSLGRTIRMQGTVGVLLGNGDGSFQQARTFDSGGITPGSLAAADLNGDGRLDLLVTNGACFQCAGTMATLLIGNGDGTFQEPINYNDGAQEPVSIAADDIDGDGLLDVAVMNGCTANTGCDGSTGALSVLGGNGDGTLQMPSVYFLWSTALGYSPNTVVLADLDNDGKPDAVIGAWTAVGVLLNQTPRAATTTTLASPINPASFGQPVAFSAAVSSLSSGTPTGAVTFSDGATVLGSAPLVSGVATFNTSSLALGAHEIRATYSSDPAFRASASTPLTEVVNEPTRIAPTIAWNPPATIVSGAPLSSLQLNATANVPGAFVYTPALGAVLAIGSQTLTATFTPADSVLYSTAQAQATIEVVAPDSSTPAAFYGIGDLPGGPFVSQVRDAAQVGGVIYAVGASAAHGQTLCSGPNNPPGCVTQFNADTPVLWRWNGTAGSLTPLPDLVASAGANGIAAAAITRNARYLASQARSSTANPAVTQAVRVTRDTLATLNLGAAPFPALSVPAAALAISEDGSIVYAVSGTPSRAVRIDIAASTSTLIPLLSPSDAINSVAPRGTSFDGSVMVGTSSAAPATATNGRAFRYVHDGAGDIVSQIPLLPGGTWNRATAVSPDGRLVLVAGDSTFAPNGEMYVYDSATGMTRALGSPNTPWSPAGMGSMTADGSAIVATFGDPTSPNGVHTAYVHNANGWFHLTTVLASQGIDISASGWSDESLQATGMSPDGTLVFGNGTHDGNTEGFVAQLPAGLLASFDVPAVPPADLSIVGVWSVADAPGEAIVFLADGTYFHLATNRGTQVAGEWTSGFERGRYTWDATGELTFATLQDTNGSIGLSGGNGARGLIATVSGDTLSAAGGAFVGTRVGGAPGSVVGGWSFGDPHVDNRSGVLLLFADQTYMLAEHGDSAIDPSGHDGVEGGVYTWGPQSGLTVNVMIDTNGGWGLSNGIAQVTRSWGLSPDDLILGPPGPHQLTRIVDPGAVVPAITSALTADGQVGSLFTYTITATHASHFDASGLPGGLAIDPVTGVISGTPTDAGTFTVTISAANAFGSSGSASLALTIAPRVLATALSVEPAGTTFGGTATLSATLTSGGSPVAGKSILFSLNGSSVGSATTNAAGVATLSAASLAGIGAGTFAAGMQAAFSGDEAYAASSGSAELTVARAIPTITWATPAAIPHGTALSTAQLNATADVTGTFAYTPAAGTILPVGAGQTLSVVFTPVDAADYTTAHAEVAITVVDVAPPTVAAPASISIHATVAGGATPSTVPALAAFLSGATAVDDGPASPVAQPPTLNGTPVTGSTVFAVGDNVVTFAFRDGAGNVGQAASVVTVVGGRPALSVSLVGVALAGAGQQIVTLRLTNTGTGNALNVNVALSSLRTLTGVGSVTVVSGLPVSSPLLGPGESLIVPIVVNAPPTVLRFALSLALRATDYTGAVLSSVATQTIIPIITTPLVLSNGPAIALGRVSVTLTWDMNEPTTGAAQYGFDTSANMFFVPDDGVFATGHTITLTGLAPRTTYSVIVTGRDAAGNVYSSVRKQFTTLQ